MGKSKTKSFKSFLDRTWTGSQNGRPSFYQLQVKKSYSKLSFKPFPHMLWVYSYFPSLSLLDSMLCSESFIGVLMVTIKRSNGWSGVGKLRFSKDMGGIGTRDMHILTWLYYLSKVGDLSKILHFLLTWSSNRIMGSFCKPYRCTNPFMCGTVCWLEEVYFQLVLYGESSIGEKQKYGRMPW